MREPRISAQHQAARFDQGGLSRDQCGLSFAALLPRCFVEVFLANCCPRMCCHPFRMSNSEEFVRGDADTVYFLLMLGVCIVCIFYSLNNYCCAIDEVEQQKRYNALREEKFAREAQDAAEEAANNSRVPYQSEPAPSAPYGQVAPYTTQSSASYSRGGVARPYGQ